MGIVGGSCAGKSWLARRLEERAKGPVARISLDDFYLDRGHLPQGRRARLNFDHPRAIDWALLESVLAGLSAGTAVAAPCYDFATHSRRRTAALIDPAPLVIVEGLWLFRNASLRRHFSFKIFIHGPTELRAARRIERDTAERGRTAEQVMEQWRRFAEPMFERHVAPQARWADAVLEAPIGEEQVAALARRLEERSEILVGI